MRKIDTPWPGRAVVIAGSVDADIWLDTVEAATAATFRLAKRRDEWILSRVAAKRLAMELGLCTDPRSCGIERPFLVIDGIATEWVVSMSHSAPYAGAAIGRTPAGIDVQVVRKISESAAHLFLSHDETDAMRRCALPHRMLHFWCAKEAAWKQRSSEFATLKSVPLRMVEERRSGILFDAAETRAIDDFIVALAPPSPVLAPR